VDELITVATFADANEATVAQIFLGDLGIRAFVIDGELVSMDWLYRNAIGYVKVQTPSDQAEVARAALENWRASRQSSPQETHDNENATACLACGATLPPDRSSCPFCGWSYVKDATVPEANSGDEHAPAAIATKSMSTDAANQEQAEREETNTSNLRLLIVLLLCGLLAVNLLPRLRDFVQSLLLN
jgi:hypothetical protein